MEPQEAPFISTSNGTSSDDSSDDLLDPKISLLGNLSSTIEDQTPLSFTGPLSGMTDGELDNILLHLHSHYQCAGISMLDGMLQHLGHQLPQECICASLIRIDPAQCVFQRIQI